MDLISFFKARYYYYCIWKCNFFQRWINLHYITFPLSEAFLEPSETSTIELFCENSRRFLTINYFRQKVPPQIFMDPKCASVCFILYEAIRKFAGFILDTYILHALPARKEFPARNWIILGILKLEKLYNCMSCRGRWQAGHLRIDLKLLNYALFIHTVCMTVIRTDSIRWAHVAKCFPWTVHSGTRHCKDFM